MYNYNPWITPYPQPLLPITPYDYLVQNSNYYLSQYCQLFNRQHYAYETIKYINYSKNVYTPKKIEFDSYREEWYCTERNERKVVIGKLSMISCHIINIKPDDTFDALYCVLSDDTGSHDVIIPYKDLTRRNILQPTTFGL